MYSNIIIGGVLEFREYIFYQVGGLKRKMAKIQDVPKTAIEQFFNLFLQWKKYASSKKKEITPETIDMLRQYETMKEYLYNQGITEKMLNKFINSKLKNDQYWFAKDK